MPGDYEIVTRRRPERTSPVLVAVDLDDPSLVQRARQGDRDAFQTLFERHRTMLTALVRRASGTSGVVEDIVQETALSALVGIERLQQPDRFGAWVAGIGLNICRRQRRQELERPSSLGMALGTRADPTPDPSEVAIEREIASSVRTAINELPSGQRQAAALFYLSGLTYRETALALGIDVGAVKTRLHKARTRLGEELSSVWKGEEMERTERRELVPVQVADVLRLPPTKDKQTEYVVMLEETGGTRRLPIWIGEPEATWLAYGIEHIELPRPGPPRCWHRSSTRRGAHPGSSNRATRRRDVLRDRARGGQGVRDDRRKAKRRAQPGRPDRFTSIGRLRGNRSRGTEIGTPIRSSGGAPSRWNDRRCRYDRIGSQDRMAALIGGADGGRGLGQRPRVPGRCMGRRVNLPSDARYTG